MKKLQLFGQVNCSGFEITARINAETNRFTTRDYDVKKEDANPPAPSLIISTILCISTLIFYVQMGLSMDIWANLFILLSVFSAGNILGSLPTLLRRKDNQWKQWHACEHKLVNIITKNNSEFPCLEKLKQMSPYNGRCGSVLIIASLLANLYIVCALPFTGYLPFTILEFIGAIYLVAIFAWSFVCPKKYPPDKFTFPTIIILACFAALILFSQQREQILSVILGSFAIQLLTKYSGIPYLAQKYIFTAEPAQEQYEETFLLALKIQAWQKSAEEEKNNQDFDSTL
ncbi:MAG: hypothetical protein HY813_01060 [Candidatus Portnoybacteria bacterium]|nr:hypothetical protein [Candidatus Portnoybacteria bacterium]